MGVDRAIHVSTDLRLDQELQPLATARLLKAIVDKEGPELVIVGKQSIDGDNSTTGAAARTGEKNDRRAWIRRTYACRASRLASSHVRLQA